jgi:hypothetical protein
VREGRAVYDNIRKFILFMLPTNGGEALVVIAAIAFEPDAADDPGAGAVDQHGHLGTLGLALAFEPAEPTSCAAAAAGPARRCSIGLLRLAHHARLAADHGRALGLFLWELGRGTAIDTARTMAVNASWRGRDVLPAQQPLAGVALFVVAEAEKLVVRRIRRRAAAQPA